jgi:Zn-dependent protease with chaperone function
MIRPLDNSFEAFYYDGLVAVRHPATVQLGVAELNIAIDQRPALVWPYSSLRFAADGTYGEPVRIGHQSSEHASNEHASAEALVIESRDFVEALRQHGVTRRAIPLNLRSWPAVLLCSIAIAIIAATIYVWGVRFASEQAARFMPAGMEKRLGNSVVAILAPENTRCVDSAHRLEPIVQRLQAASGSKQQFQIIYVNQSIVNAFAAPGGYIVVFRGLLDQAQSAEEFAGVLAHEMQHVLLKHSTRALAREFSGRALLSLMAIDSSGTPTAIQASVRLANLSYQRGDEEAADLQGAQLLDRAHINSAGLVTFFRRLEANSPASGTAMAYLSNHPATEDRIDALEAETRQFHSASAPLMSTEEWAAARDVCSGK